MRASLIGLLALSALSLAANSNSSLVSSNRTDILNVSEAIERVKAEKDAEPNFLLNSAFSILGTDAPAELLELPVGTCNAETPCVNGACCSGISGLCGYSPSECGVGNCTSNCDAKAECGHFCGSTDDFCDAEEGCQKDFGGCGPPKRPSCSKDGTSINKRSIGYYETWVNTRPCSSVSPEQLNLQGLTHVNFAFMFFEPDTFELTPMDKNAGSLISRFTKLKERKPGLEIWVSVGGWSFNDPGKYQQAFSTMSSTAANRKKFIGNLIRFMETYGFDGMDMDWEYPTADDRGGKPDDKANFVLLSKDIKEAFSKKGYGYSLTLPSSYWYLQHFDLAKLQPYVDWFNLMSYDLHGTWDAASKFVGPYVATHTNLTEIDLGLDLLWRAGVKSENVVLGQGLYGRSFTLKDSNCNKPNGVCQFSGGAKAGPCSKASGILNLQEIFDIIDEKKLKPTHDKTAGVKWINWDNDQWVSYDDDETLLQKREFAASRCLGGMMIWALDQIDQDSTIGGSMTPEEMEEAEAIYQDEAAKGVCYTTMCDDKCRTGDHEAAQMRGQPGLLSTMSCCPKDQVRRLCCSKGTTMGTCKWRGFRGLGLSCTGGCGDGETEVTTNTNHVTKDEDQTCTGGAQSYCCSGFKPPISREQIGERFKDEAADLALEAAETLALEIAAKAFCRVAIMAATLPLRLTPFVGWIASIALQVAMPALVQVCAKGVAKAGKSVFKFKGKDYEVKVDKPLTSKADRPATKSPTKASDKPKTCKTKKLQARAFRNIKSYTTPRAKQACYNYSSVIARRRDLQSLTCPSDKALRAPRPIVGEYNEQHHTAWSSGWLQEADLECERDEYPGASVWQARDNSVWIRLIPATDNSRAAWLFGGCPDREEEHLVGERSIGTSVDGCRTYDVWQRTLQKMETVIDIQFTNMGNMPPDFGITANPCWPKTLVNDPGFALLTDDPWYRQGTDRDEFIEYYEDEPGTQFTNGKVNKYSWGYTKPRGTGNNNNNNPPSDDDSDTDMPDPSDDDDDDPSFPGRRALDEFDNGNRSPGDLVIREGNSTRRPTSEELFEDLGLLRCEDQHCQREMEELGYASLPVVRETATSPAMAEAVATPSITGSSPEATIEVPASLSYALEVAAEVSDAARSIITPAPRHNPTM
ncbi:glycosyl hydrolase family 18 [Colletotrichum camelliae]|nr:glycosyl hydrolase family 18 [Colletotrichum camelliae]